MESETNSNATTVTAANRAVAPRVFIPAAAIILGAIIAAFVLSNISVLVSDDVGIVEVGDSVNGEAIDTYVVAEDGAVVDADGNEVTEVGGSTVAADAEGHIYAVNDEGVIVAHGDVEDADGNVTSDGEPVVINNTSFAINDEGVITDAEGNEFTTDEDDFTVNAEGERVDLTGLSSTYSMTAAPGGLLFLSDSGEVIGTGLQNSLATYSMTSANTWISESLGWYYIAAVVFFIVLSLAFGLSRFGKLRLGKDENDRPEFSRLSWFSMLFSAGMGIGLVFYGASEPLMHLQAPPYAPADAAGTPEAAKGAMLATYMHWGIHPWAIYVVLGLAIAFAVHRKGRPVTIRWALEPLLGEKRVRGALGDLIDVTAVVATLFGVATSLGLGSAQINAGLTRLFGAENLPSWATAAAGGGTVLQIVVIALITSIAVWSVLTGVKKGIKWLSNINMMLAAAILVFFIILGPTLFIFREFFSALGYYFQNILNATFNAGAFPVEAGADPAAFQTAWTVFYWGWWLSWAPFVAVFIARISKGRTIREFVIGVLLVPTIVSFIWFAALGGTGIDQQVNQGKNVTFSDEADGLYVVLDNMPWTLIMTGLATILVVTFFVTSSDSGSLVIDMLSSGGNIDPPKVTRLFWAILEGAAAIALLLVGGLDALKYAAIILALPFSVVLIGAGIATWKGISKEFDDTLIRRAGGPPKVDAEKTPEPV